MMQPITLRVWRRPHETGISSVLCSVLQPSSIRGLATLWTYFLHLSLSSFILIDSSTGSPVHVLMLSIQAVRGLPRLTATEIVTKAFTDISMQGTTHNNNDRLTAFDPGQPG